ncbi:MAG: hypothetical protein IJ562_03285 [Prevotella sp.]|nr:hypothetical protein [Prevotella sp.]
MNTRKTIITATMLSLMQWGMPAFGQLTYRTKELKRLSTILRINENTLKEGYNHLAASGLNLTVHVKENEVNHIGLSLFSDDMRRLDGSPVFDFLERYFLQLKFPPVTKSASHMLRDDQFKFLNGSLKTVDTLQPSDVFIYNYDHYLYTATWSRSGKTILAVSFPVEYQLMSGENKIEAENHLFVDIMSTTANEETAEYMVTHHEHYISEDFSNRIYFKGGQLLNSISHPAETAANMMLSPFVQGKYQLHVSQLAYGFRKAVFNVPLKQWIWFCKNSGCRLFFGIEDIDEKSNVKAVVIAVNNAENYNHVLTVSIPAETIEQRSGTIEAQLYSFIPTHNVMNLFSSFRKSHKKNISHR